MNIIVSISCVTYNHAPYIRQCLDGFLAQECNFQYEILIHDDASIDGTQEIIKEYAAKHPDIFKPMLQTINQYSQSVRGMNATFNLPRVKGKYIALCEVDDYWTDPFKLQKQVDFLENNDDYVACQHHRIILDQDYNQRLEQSKKYIFTQCILFKNIIDSNFLEFI